MMTEKIAMPVPFEDKTVEYYMDARVHESHDDTTKIRGRTNPETWQLMKNRYVVLKNFLPKEMIRFAMDTWRVDEENDGHYTHQETHDITYKNPNSSIGKSKGGYCTPWGVALHGFIHNKLKDYIDMDLRETYSFTRKYTRGAYLGTHVDRPSCEISATLCLDYKTDDNKPWKIWVRNDRNYAKVPSEQIKQESQDFNHRERLKNNCKAVSLEPGDILLYQGPNIPHWRDYLLGDYSYHLFVHFFNAQSRLRDLDEFIVGENHDVNTAQPRYALELDGRPNRWTKTQTVKEFQEFSKAYDEIVDDELLRKMVNNYDDWKLVENKK